MKRLYLAGPMSGLPSLNFPAFHAEAARLRALGYEIINPAEINAGADEAVAFDKMTPEERKAHWCKCMKLDIRELMTCDGIALMPGWWRSEGAKLECQIASKVGMAVYDVCDLVEPLAAPAQVLRATDWAAA